MHDMYEVRSRSVDVRQELRSFCGRRITLHIEVGVSVLLEVDFNLLLHVLENFASNAGKYGGGTVHLSVSRTTSGNLTFTVTNPPGKDHAMMVERFGEDASSLFSLGV